MTSATSPCQAAAEVVGSTPQPGERAGAPSPSSECGRRDAPPLVRRCGLCFRADAHLLVRGFTQPRQDLDLAQGPLFHNPIQRQRLQLLFEGLTSPPPRPDTDFWSNFRWQAGSAEGNAVGCDAFTLPVRWCWSVCVSGRCHRREAHGEDKFAERCVSADGLG